MTKQIKILVNKILQLKEFKNKIKVLLYKFMKKIKISNKFNLHNLIQIL